MRNELEQIETIERYLMNRMSGEEKTSFEEKLKNDTKLQEEVSMQRNLMEGMKRLALKKAVAKAQLRYKWIKGLTSFGLGTFILTAATVGALWANGNFENQSQGTDTGTKKGLPELNESGDSLWADADKYLPSQKFIINTNSDTVIETKGGIVMVIPAGTFAGENGNTATGTVEYEVKEALDAASIISAGLETKSGNKLLETGGMFYVNARQNGKSLKIDPSKGIYTEVPAGEIKAGMQLYDGIRKPNGSIDWVNPKPLVKDLTPVNILNLDFYPPLYLDSLGAMGYDNKNKTFTDSLYYSFADLFETEWAVAAIQNTNDPKEESTNEIEVKNTISISNHSRNAQKDIVEKKPFDYVKANFSITQTGNIAEVIISLKMDKGWKVYSTIQKDSDGPLASEINLVPAQSYRKLGAVSESPVKSKYFEGFDGIYNYFENEALLKQKIRITSTRDFLLRGEFVFMQCDDKGCLPPCYVPFSLNVKGVAMADSIAYDTGIFGVNPAKIKTIWSEEFQNTNLATREFEERLKTIHQTCSNNVLDIYVNNLDKNLSTVDSMAAGSAGGLYSKFMDFAARGDGKAEVNSLHQKKLTEYYTKKHLEYTTKITKASQAWWDNHEKMNKEAEERRESEKIKNLVRETGNFLKEYIINLDEACRQLGRPKYKVMIGTTGWKNIDTDQLAFDVFESTANRETLDYTDPNTGKKAVIRYELLTAEINDKASFDRLLVYLLPDQLNSFMRMPDVNGRYEEKLNELFSYHLVCVGYKEEQPYFCINENVKPGNYSNLQMAFATKDELNLRLNKLKNISYTGQITEDLTFQVHEIREQQRQKKVNDIIELRNRLMKVVFPCYVSEL